MDDKFQNDYPKMYGMFINMFNRINELEYQNAELKYELKRFEKLELANGAIRKYVNDNMRTINYIDQYLKDIGSI